MFPRFAHLTSRLFDLSTKFLEGGLGRNQRRFSDEDRRLSWAMTVETPAPNKSDPVLSASLQLSKDDRIGRSRRARQKRTLGSNVPDD